MNGTYPAQIRRAALARIRKRVAILTAQARGEAVTASDTSWDRLIDGLAPDSVMINSFPWTSLMMEFMELTDERRVHSGAGTPKGAFRAHIRADKSQT